MTRFGYFLSCEEFSPAQLLEQASLAERHGFEALWISDHYHPWNEAQGQSAFVWSMLGALSASVRLPVTTAVTCPTVRIHPAIIAQAAATTQMLHDGRFTLGVGSGEALNEHILGDRWPPTDTRLELLEEAIQVIRKLFAGRRITHHGRHYTVENARLYTVPETPPKIYMSGFGAKSMALAGRIADGFICTKPDPEAVKTFRDAGGMSKPAQGGLKVCWAPSEDEAVDIVHRTWANELIPGELAQVLPEPAHFEQASQVVTKDMVRQSIPCGPDPERHLKDLREYVDAGYDEIYINNIGPHQERFFRFYAEEILPRLR